MYRITTALILVTILFGGTAFAQDKSLVGYWSFDEIVDGQFEEHVSGEMGGTIYGCSEIDGPVGQALGFDGIDDYARLPGNGMSPPAELAELGEGSISVWFRVDDIPDYGIRPIFYYGMNDLCDFFDASNMGLIIEVGHSPIHNGSQRLYLTIWSNECYFPTFCYDSWNPIIEGEWYHYVAVVGGDYNTGYLNGLEMTDRHYNFGNSATSQFFEDAWSHEAMELGRGHWDENIMYFQGGIDELKIFSAPLAAQQVEQLYLEGLVTDVAGPDEMASIQIYPNPSSDIIRVKPSPGKLSFAYYTLRNTDGVDGGRYLATQDEIDVSRLPAGTYIITAYSAKDQPLGSGKFVKE
jgi:hypothetical protein